jgi:hypothetical protein
VTARQSAAMDKALAYLKAGHTQAQSARMAGVHRVSLYRAVKRLKP